ncbi:MAG: hypothetical protein ACE5F1_02045, partial [Planctomycetota bacterium]
MNSRFQFFAVALVLLLAAGGFLFVLLGEDPAGPSVVGFSEGELETVEEDPAELEAAFEEAEPDSGVARVEEAADPALAPGSGTPAKALLVLEGRVVDTSGQGVADAEVSLFMRRSLEALFRGRGRFDRGNRRQWQDLFRLKKVARSVRTGKD